MPRNPMASSPKPHFISFALSFTTLFLSLAAIIILRSPSASSQAQFADPAFQATWERTDGPVASGSLQRAWVWGPEPGRTLTETFAGIPGDSHLVQYFDKGRMEINDPNADTNDPFYVTNGLLSVELISGLQQTGLNSFNDRGPASINLASDPDDPSAPTYQSFNGVSNLPSAPTQRRANSAIGQSVNTAIDRQGRTQPWPQNHPDYSVIIAYFEPVTGHNVPDVFWNYLNAQGKIVQNSEEVNGPLFFPTFAVTGYPISEPYWSYVKIEGIYSDALIQAYERRVLTYVPRFQVGYKVQMGNVGQHYYQWRYGSGSGAGDIAVARSEVRIDGISYRKSLTDLNNNYAIITNGGQIPVSIAGWRLDSPKWDHVDRFSLPKGTLLAPGASVRVHSGPGQNTETDIYMFRTSVMWDEIGPDNAREGAAYNLAILYDNTGREVSRFFPAADVGGPPTPTQAAAPTATVAGRATPTTGKEVTVTPSVTATAIPGATATPTKEAPPTPIPTGSPSPVTGNQTLTPTATGTTTTQ